MHTRASVTEQRNAYNREGRQCIKRLSLRKSAHSP